MSKKSRISRIISSFTKGASRATKKPQPTRVNTSVRMPGQGNSSSKICHKCGNNYNAAYVSCPHCVSIHQPKGIHTY